MKELHGTEWYGEYATLTDEHNDYVQIEYKCNGTGRLYDYTLFPGIDLIFMDFNCSDTFHEPIPNKNIIEIRHYQKGRVEFELRNNKVFHMKEGEFCINALANIPAAYSFPFGYSVGLSCVIDKDSVDVETQQIFSYYNIDVLNLGRELELEKSGFYVGHHSGCYISLKNCMLQKVLKSEIISASNYWNYFTISNSCGLKISMRQRIMPKNKLKSSNASANSS